MFDPHMAFNRFKQHPFVSTLLAGGQMVRYGAKALPEGGWNTIPQVFMDGALIAGDAGGFLNSMRLKGIHLAMRTGMLAAETAFEAVRSGDTSSSALRRYQDRIEASAVKASCIRSATCIRRSATVCFRAAFAGLSLATRGWLAGGSTDTPGHERMKTLAAYYGTAQAAPAEASNRRRSTGA